MDALAQYALIFVLAATPFVEIMIVIPLGIGMGLAPVPVAVIAFAGNALPIWGIIVGWQWWLAHRGPPRRHWGERAQHVWHRYGLPGLALSAPVVTGVHLATVMALMMHAGRGRTAAWMAIGLVAWTVPTTLVSVWGIASLKAWWGA